MEYSISLLETVAKNESYRRVLYTGDIELTIETTYGGFGGLIIDQSVYVINSGRIDSLRNT